MLSKKCITKFILVMYTLVLFCPIFIQSDENLKSIRESVRDDKPPKPISGPPNPPWGE